MGHLRPFVLLREDHQESPAKWCLEETAGGGGGVLERHLQEKSLPEKASLFCGWQVMAWGVTYSPGKRKTIKIMLFTLGLKAMKY